MGTYTFSTFQSSLTFELGQRHDLSSQVDDWINSAYLDLCTRNKFWNVPLPADVYFPEMLKLDTSRATAANTKFIAVPADCITIYHVHDTTNDKALDYYEVREYGRKTGRSTAGSYNKPTKWARLGNRLYFFPTPDSNYNLEIFYRKRPSLMSASSDTTEIDAMWDESVLKLAVYQSLMRLKRYDVAENERKEWIEMVAGKIGIYNQDRRSGRTPIQPDHIYKMAGRP